MPQNGFTIGTDLSVVLFAQYMDEGEYKFPDGTSFDAVPTTEEVDIKPFSKKAPIPLRFLGVWRITIEGSRSNHTLDDFWNRLEAGFYANENQLGGTLIQTIQETDGSISQWLYTGVILTLESPGTFKQNEAVTYRVTGRAERKQKISI